LQIRSQKPYYTADPEVDSLVSKKKLKKRKLKKPKLATMWPQPPWQQVAKAKDHGYFSFFCICIFAVCVYHLDPKQRRQLNNFLLFRINHSEFSKRHSQRTQFMSICSSTWTELFSHFIGQRCHTFRSRFCACSRGIVYVHLYILGGDIGGI